MKCLSLPCGSKKLDQTTADMKKLAAALDQEKKKTDMLLYQMLPVKVANQLRDGRTVEAGNNQIILHPVRSKHCVIHALVRSKLCFVRVDVMQLY